jgi:MerR family copper efflux transcriptional regulator
MQSKANISCDPKLLRVGELAKAVGKTVRALHLYEELGLLNPVSRSSGGFRLYGDDAVARVNWISTLQDMGFSLPDIQGLLRDFEGAETGPAAMARVRFVFEEKLRETRETMARLGSLEQELSASLAYLDSCVAKCEPTHVTSDCRGCDHHGHTAAVAPDLVAGIQGARPAQAKTNTTAKTARIDVPLAHLTEGNR